MQNPKKDSEVDGEAEDFVSNFLQQLADFPMMLCWDKWWRNYNNLDEFFFFLKKGMNNNF